MTLAPCLPTPRRLMPDAAWLRFLGTHANWHAPLLAAVACAGAAGAPLSAGPNRTADFVRFRPLSDLPWIGAPGWVRHAQPGVIPAAYEFPALGFAGSSTDLGGAARRLGAHVAPSALVAGSGHLLGNTEQLTALASPAAPQPVPEPSALACVLVGIVAVLVGRRV